MRGCEPLGPPGVRAWSDALERRCRRIYREEHLWSADGAGQAGFRHTGADAGPTMAERPLVARFCCRLIHRLRVLVVVDDGTRECLALIADTSISGVRVARELDRLLGEHGKPKTIVSDNGTDLTLQSADDHTRRALALNIEENGFLRIRGASSPCHSANVDVPVFF
jgi:transposase InsO family protein